MTTRAVAHVNVAAIARNCERLRRELDSAVLCAVVKSDGYGHGAVPAAHAALAGGAQWLAVAAATEARELRESHIDEPILVMGALSPLELEIALEAKADVVAWSHRFVRDLAATGRNARVHVKFDSGMGRLGTRDADTAHAVADVVAEEPALDLVGAMTHFATADERDDPFFAEQLDRFTAWSGRLAARHPGVLLHAANSAGTLRDKAAHFGMVRCGIAVYGMDPFGNDPEDIGLEPALALHSYVGEVKAIAPGESAGYGRRFIAEAPSTLAVLPIGYGDGVRRALTNNAEVLVGGRRYPLVGTVSMDNVTLDLGPATTIAVGAEAVLIGSQGSERVLAEEWARRLQTINYEVTCGLTQRVPRVYHSDGDPL